MSGDCPRVVGLALASTTSCDCARTCSSKWQDDVGTQLKQLSREELEIEFYNLHTKNECLSKALKDNVKQIKRLNRTIKKNEEDRRRCLSPTKQLYEDRISQLEQSNHFLQDKVLVLRHQLQSHSRLHAKAHRNSSHHSRSINSTKTSQTHLSHLPIPESENLNQDEKNDLNEGLNVDLVENDNRILQLQSELDENPGDAARVAENIELIRLRRLVKRQSAQLATLNAHLEVSDKELEQLRTSYDQASLENDQVLKQLMNEKQRIRVMQTELIELGNFKQDIKILQEQVRDLLSERSLLRSNNDKLLEIASGKTEEDNSQQQKNVTDKETIEQESTKEEAEKSIYSYDKTRTNNQNIDLKNDNNDPDLLRKLISEEINKSPNICCNHCCEPNNTKITSMMQCQTIGQANSKSISLNCQPVPVPIWVIKCCENPNPALETAAKQGLITTDVHCQTEFCTLAKESCNSSTKPIDNCCQEITYTKPFENRCQEITYTKPFENRQEITYTKPIENRCQKFSCTKPSESCQETCVAGPSANCYQNCTSTKLSASCCQETTCTKPIENQCQEVIYTKPKADCCQEIIHTKPSADCCQEINLPQGSCVSSCTIFARKVCALCSCPVEDMSAYCGEDFGNCNMESRSPPPPPICPDSCCNRELPLTTQCICSYPGKRTISEKAIMESKSKQQETSPKRLMKSLHGIQFKSQSTQVETTGGLCCGINGRPFKSCECGDKANNTHYNVERENQQPSTREKIEFVDDRVAAPSSSESSIGSQSSLGKRPKNRKWSKKSGGSIKKQPKKSWKKESSKYRNMKKQGTFTLWIDSMYFTSPTMERLNGMDSKPYVFLTWTFLELQDKAYSTIMPAKKAIFNCSSVYRGDITLEMLHYMCANKVKVECHIAVNDSSRMISYGEIDVSEAIYKPNVKCKCKVVLNGPDDISAVISCWFKFECPQTILKNVLGKR
ncbi:uncharacterized protein LOC111055280 isoform X2 [Nilaparvata lugens]|uniref:uncharacterized protein LOC111055280 isoform X2 n=1 Tax=Nilaparvata lugens TaxID=108931 RepID=UPI00193EA20E|nr:uncharacterized protein LOC111055280 isoform X2 [Nilaparvata lugens]